MEMATDRVRSPSVLRTTPPFQGGERTHRGHVLPLKRGGSRWGSRNQTQARRPDFSTQQPDRAGRRRAEQNAKRRAEQKHQEINNGNQTHI